MFVNQKWRNLVNRQKKMKNVENESRKTKKLPTPITSAPRMSRQSTLLLYHSTLCLWVNTASPPFHSHPPGAQINRRCIFVSIMYLQISLYFRHWITMLMVCRNYEKVPSPFRMRDPVYMTRRRKWWTPWINGPSPKVTMPGLTMIAHKSVRSIIVEQWRS